MSRAKLNYWIDVAIGIAGVISATTGLVQLLPAGSTAAILGVSLRLWSTTHTWSSLAAVAGVGVHLALHWKWARAMSGRVLAGTRREAVVTSAEPVPATAGGPAMSRRAFLALGGATAVAVGLAAAGYKVVAQAAGGDDGANSTASGNATGVACPRGLVNDPYPGQCRHYVDSDGDGICDYSVAASGSQVAGTFGEGGGGAFPGRQPDPGRP
jgi:hypothetical protein